MLNIQENIPIYAIFILILILSGGYVIQLIPCRLQRLLNENIYIKHFFGLLTLIFLINLTDPDERNATLNQILYKSFILYLFFIVIIKTQYKFFMMILLLIGFIFILQIKKNEYKITNVKDEDFKNIHKEEHKNIKKEEILKNIEVNEKIEKTEKIIFIQNILFGIMILFIIIGFITYLGQKKYEYKDKFNFITFIFGKPDCSFSVKKISIKNSISHVFD
jgi:hypothetical protein